MADGAGADGAVQGGGAARRLLVPLALVALVAAAHAGSLHNPFQYDDRSFIVENEHVRTWPGPLRYLRPPVLDSGGTLRAFYRPVTMLSFHASFRLGESAVGFRLVDLGLHAAAVLLLFALAGRLFGRLAADGRFPAAAARPAAALAAAVLAVHPLATPTINEISQRDTLLAAVFTLGAVLAYLAALERIDRAAERRVGAGGGSADARGVELSDRAAERRVGAGGWLPLAALGAVLQALGLGSKEVAVATPALLLLCDWLVLRPARRTAPPRLVVYGASAALSAALGVAFVAWVARGHYPAPLPYESIPTAAQYVLGQPLVVVRYLVLLVSPVGLSAYHEVAVVTSAARPAFLLPTLGLAALAAGAVALRRRAPEATLAVLGALIHLVPTSVARNPIAMDEDRAYLVIALYGLAAAGLLARAAALLARRHGRAASRAAAGVALLAVVALATLAALRGRDWSTPVRLWESALEVHPTSRSAALFLAGALAEEGRQADRLRVLDHAVRTHPHDVRTRLFYAHALAVANRPREAWALAAQLERDAPRSAEVQTLLGHLHRASGDLPRAAAAYQQALRLDPGSTTACLYLADCRRAAGDLGAARRLLGCVPPHARLSAGERALYDGLRRGSP